MSDVVVDRTLPLIAITGSQRPYIYDLPHVLSLPEGFEFRFRYRHLWVDKTLASEVRANSPLLLGKELILLFHSQETKRLIPIRRCTVISIENIGPLVFLRFSVGQFPAVDAAALMLADGAVPDATVEQLGGIGLEILGELGLGVPDLEKPLPPHSYLRYAAARPRTLAWAPETKAPDVGTAWARLAVCLLQEPNLATVPMFHVLGFQKAKGSFVEPKPMKHFSISRQKVSGFRLVEGVRYKLRVLGWCEPPPGSVLKSLKVKPDFRPEVLQLYGGSDLVVGRYDIVEFTFQAGRPGYTELAIRAEPLQPSKPPASDPWSVRRVGKSEKAFDWPAIFSVRVPIRVRINIPRVFRALVIAAAGASIYGLVPLYFTSYPEFWKGLGLFLLFAAAGEYLERFVKFNESMRKFLKAE